MRKTKISNDSRRLAYRDFMLATTSESTVRGYISSLDCKSVIGDISEELFMTRDVFEITDSVKLSSLYAEVVKSPSNKLSHSRYSAALNSYIKYVNFLE